MNVFARQQKSLRICRMTTPNQVVEGLELDNNSGVNETKRIWGYTDWGVFGTSYFWGAPHKTAQGSGWLMVDILGIVFWIPLASTVLVVTVADIDNLYGNIQ